MLLSNIYYGLYERWGGEGVATFPKCHLAYRGWVINFNTNIEVGHEKNEQERGEDQTIKKQGIVEASAHLNNDPHVKQAARKAFLAHCHRFSLFTYQYHPNKLLRDV